jgi:hypothetical protein
VTSRSSLWKSIFTPFVMAVAFIYFVVDALFLSIIKPLSRRLARLPLFTAVRNWIASFGPYTTLGLFLVPLVLLEPVKPVGVYLIAAGHPVRGVVIIAVGELLKIFIVERIFDIGRDKLMTIPLFARAYTVIMGWLMWLKALPAWQAVLRQYRAMTQWLRRHIHSRA